MIPLRKAGPHNKAGDIGLLVNKFEKLAAVISCAHTTPRAIRPVRSRSIGLTDPAYLAWDPGTIMKLTAHKEPDALSVEIGQNMACRRCSRRGRRTQARHRELSIFVGHQQ
jgi:hypothetical protein